MAANDEATAGSYDATVRLWDLKSKSYKPLMIMTEAKDSISSVCVSGHEIFSASIDGRVRIYDIRMGTVKIDVIGCTSTILSSLLPPPLPA
jgi:mitogen-activated protein kinase organizer 1